ncbi:PREDICTED: titin-like [Priapulus caudatus]|uniref:Titin-like n=1 Tax=Priapulus caudatus TaxID=37621 RepID=A0ABM1DVW6_PRICU|nr:PREDICTED: titin-like [Priapulus caudatus]
MLGPGFAKVPGDVECREGQLVRFDCRVTGRPYPDVEWYHNDVLVSDDAAHKVTVNEYGVHSLLIFAADVRDAGSYICVARNPMGESSFSVKLTVVPRERVMPPKFVEHFPSVRANEGEHVTFHCRAVGEPTPTLTWHKDGIQIVPSRDIQIDSHDGTSMLVMPRCRRDDAAWYECTAINVAGSVTTRGKLDVHVDHKPVEYREIYLPTGKVKPRGPGDSGETIWLKPVEMARYERRESHEDIRLKEVRHTQQREVTSTERDWEEKNVYPFWQKKPVVETRRETIYLKPTKFEHHAEDEQGETIWLKPVARERYIVTEPEPEVHVPAPAPRPLFLTQLNNISRLPERQRAVFECQVEPVSEPSLRILWYANGKPITQGPRFQMEISPSGMVRLTITEAYVEDSGVYTCKATTSSGEAYTSATLRVESVATRPTLVQGLKDLSNLKEGDSAHFEVHFTPADDKDIIVEWFHNGKPIPVGGRFITGQRPGVATLDISPVLPEDSGVITCRITNKGGSVTSSANMHCAPTDIGNRPVFINPLNNQLGLKEGGLAHFEARVEPHHDPKLKVEWFCNGAPLKIGSRFKPLFDFGFVALDICPVYPEDSAIYVCKATNEYGQATTSATLECFGEEGTKRPVFVSQLNDLPGMQEGQAAHFECRVEPANDPTLRAEWFHDGKPIVNGPRHRTNLEFGLASLDINPLVPGDAGVYICKVTNEYGSSNTSGSMHVLPKVQPKPPTFVSTLRAQTADEGKKVIFECRYEPARDHVTIQWYHNGQPIPVGARFKTKQDFGVAVLEINPVHLEDSGVYSCHITTEWGDDDTSASLTVNEKLEGKAPVFISPLNNQMGIVEGKLAHFEARVEPHQDPKLKVEWFCNGRPLKVGSRFRPLFDFGFVALDISPCYLEDNGEYVCRAYNDYGEAFSTCILECIDDSARRPRITGPLNHLPNMLEDMSAHFECRAEPGTDETLRAEWFHDGLPIVDGPRHRTKLEHGVATLDISPLGRGDSGVYTCKFTNQYGTTQTSASMRVDAKVQPKPPVFVSPLHAQTADEGKSVRFECHFTPKDAPVKVEWFLNGEPIPHGSRYRTSQDFGVAALEISPVHKEDSGLITCQITTEWGSAQTSAQLTCAPKETTGNKPVFINPLNNQLGIIDGKLAHFEARVEPHQDPKLRVEWFHNGFPLKIGTRFRPLFDFGFVALDISPCYTEDSGVYTCRAWNDYGEAIATATLEVISDQGTRRPVFVSALNHLPGMKEGMAAHFQCKVEPANDPTLRAEWFHDGVPIVDGPRHRTSLEFGIATLDINPLVPADAGMYVCKVTNDFGTAQSSATMGVEPKERPQPPVFVSPIQARTIREGYPCRFEARYEPARDPGVRVEWFHDGQPIPVGTRFRPSTDFGIAALDIKPTEVEDTGTYTCQVTNDYGQAQSSAPLQCTAKKTGMRPKFLTPLRPQHGLMQGKTAHFECRLEPTDDPILRVEWYHNGQPLKTGSRFRPLHDFGFVALDINPVYPEDSGEYICRAVNDYGEDHNRTTLECMGDRPIDWTTQHPEGLTQLRHLEQPRRLRPSEERTTGRAPVFTSKLRDVPHVAEGSGAHFEARLEPANDPDLVVEWFFDGEPLKTGHRFRTIHDFGFVVLDILYVYPEDTGEYVCKATNKYGQATTTAQLGCRGKSGISYESQHPEGLQQIKYLEHPKDSRKDWPEEVKSTQKPQFVTQLRDLPNAKESQGVHFEARLEPHNDPNMQIEWYHNGKPLEHGHRFRPMHDFGYVVLDILYVYPEDSGEYVCRAVNNVGEDQTRAVLHVQDKAGIVYTSGLPDEAQIVEKIQNLEEYGRQRARKPFEADLLYPKPVFTTHIKDVANLVERQKAHFEARLEPANDPDLKVEWYFNGKPLEAANRITPYHDFGFVALDIGDTKDDDSGVYMCRAWNKAGEAFTTASLRVHPLKGLILETQLPDSKAADEIDQLEAYQAQKARRPTWGEAEPAWPRPTFTTPLQPSVDLVEGSRLHVEGRLVPIGDPNMKVEWYKNGVPLDYGNRINTMNDFGYVALDIFPAIPEDEGVYTCRAVNKAGEATSGSTVRCQPKESMYLHTIHPEGLQAIQRLESYQRRPVRESPERLGQKPIFITQIPNIECSENQRSFFECQLEPATDPKMKVEWFFNGQPLVAGHRFKPTHDFGYVTLEILYTNPEDSGVYVCRATNDMGEAVTSATLHCTGKKSIYLDTTHPAGPQAIEELKDLEDLAARRAIHEIWVPEEHKQKPVFVTQVQNIDNLREGDSAAFEARLEPTNDPKMQVEWYRNGEPLPSGTRFTTMHDFGYVRADIATVYPEDEGLYVCRAFNEVGEAFTSATLKCAGKPSIYGETMFPEGLDKIRQLEDKPERVRHVPEEFYRKPVWTTPLENVDNLVEGGVAHLSGRVEPLNDPNLKVEWYFNGEPLVAGTRYSTTFDFGYAGLDINNVQPEHTGVYMARAYNAVGEALTTATVKCAGMPSIYTGPLHPEGLDQIQMLEADKEPQARYVPETAKEPPRFLTQLQHLPNLVEGDHAHFEARLVPINDPELVVEWYHDGQPVEAASRVKMIHDFGFVVLEIEGVNPEDSGEYVCRAYNPQGEDTTTGSLTAQPKSAIVTSTNLPEHQRLVEKIKEMEDDSALRFAREPSAEKELQPPKFITELQTYLDLTEGESVHLEARLEPLNDPTLEVEWFFNGEPLEASHRFRTIHDFGFVVLEVQFLLPEYTGEYMCRARNPAGEDMTKCELKIAPKLSILSQTNLPDQQRIADKINDLEASLAPGPSMPGEGEFVPREPPRFITQPDNVDIHENDSAHFEARLEPINDPTVQIEWFLNNEPLEASHRHKGIHDFGFVILDISNCFPRDTGEYVCRAWNDIGEDFARATLKCGDDLTGQPPWFTQELMPIEGLNEGDSGHFEGRVEPSKDPDLRTEWFFNGKPVRSGHRFKTILDFGFTILDINPVYPEDQGEYVCRVYNKYGEAFSRAPLSCSGKRNVIYDTQLPPGMEEAMNKIQDLDNAPKYPGPAAPEEVAGQPPEFIVPLNDITDLTEGDSCHNEARVIPVGDPDLYVEWFFNGEPLTIGSRFKTVFDFGFVTIDISPVYDEDTGEYKCVATNKYGQAETKAIIKCTPKTALLMDTQLPESMRAGMQKIKDLEDAMDRPKHPEEPADAGEPPKFIVPLTSPVVTEGAPAHLEARLVPIGDPTMRVHWFRNGEPFNLGTRLTTMYDFGLVWLDINPAWPEDVAEYTCVAINKWGQDQTTGNLSVTPIQEVGEPPKFVTQLPTVDVPEGDVTHLEAKLIPVGDPTMRVTWFFNGEPLHVAGLDYLRKRCYMKRLRQWGSRFVTEYDIGLVKLDVSPTWPEDVGEYKCVATNRWGQDETVGAVNIIPAVEKGEPPKFVTQLPTPEVMEGQPTHLEAQLVPVNDPTMNVQWFFKGEPLISGTKYIPKYDFGLVELDITQTWPEDVGEYKCVAVNKWGMDETAGGLNVKPSPERGEPPKFTTQLQRPVVPENTPAHLDAKLIPINDPTMVVAWFFNGKPLPTGTKYRTNLDFGHVEMDITQTWPEDVGEYKCVAVNKYGRDETTGGLALMPSPERGEPPKFRRNSNDLVSIVGLIYHNHNEEEIRNVTLKGNNK